MKYINAAEILPEKLLRELQTYADGELLYIPKASAKKEWGASSGSKLFYQERNQTLRKLFQEGCSVEMLAKQYGLAYSTVKNIIYQQ